jgi:CheY-specific phosphatase CheX
VRQEILAALVEAVRQVFKDTDIAIDSVEPGAPPGAETQVISSVGLTGDLKGIVMLYTDRAGAAGIVRGMVGGLRFPEPAPGFGDLHLAAIGEISNQIAGRAITLLFDQGLRCDITPPAVVAAAHLQSLVPDVSESCQRTFRGPFGRLSVFLGIQRAERGDPLQKTS